MNKPVGMALQEPGERGKEIIEAGDDQEGQEIIAGAEYGHGKADEGDGTGMGGLLGAGLLQAQDSVDQTWK